MTAFQLALVDGSIPLVVAVVAAIRLQATAGVAVYAIGFA